MPDSNTVRFVIPSGSVSLDFVVYWSVCEDISDKPS